MFDYARLPHEFRRNFLPAHLAPSDWGQLEKAFTSLENREIRSRKELEEWLGDESELSAAIFEESAVRYVRMTTQTGNNDYEKAYLDFVENVQPKAKEREFLLDRKYVGCGFRSELRKDYYYVIDRRKENNVSLFRNENVELEKQDAKLGQQYYKVAGAMTVQFEGQERTMQYMRRYLEEPDRGLRQRAWEASEGRRLRDRGKLDQVFDDLVRVRHRIAVNAGFENYRDYAFRKKERFEYTPEDAFRFHDAVEGSFVPLAREIYEKAKKSLGIDTLRPWDIFTDPEGKPPLLPFNNAEDLVRGCIQIHESVSPDLAKQFKRLRDLNLLDLESRPGKAPGGYNYELSEVRLPFIFTNAVGRDDDVYTLLHESGHAFHTFATREAGLLFDYRGESIPSEFAEVASTAM
ncbi:MAG: M3 family oligoendopeptidase, partial [Thaumarchaeota archaeon]